MLKHVEVTVAGVAGTGTCALAELIANYFKATGLHVILENGNCDHELDLKELEERVRDGFSDVRVAVTVKQIPFDDPYKRIFGLRCTAEGRELNQNMRVIEAFKSLSEDDKIRAQSFATETIRSQIERGVLTPSNPESMRKAAKEAMELALSSIDAVNEFLS